MAAFEFARSLYPYSAEGEDLGLPFSEGIVLHYLEDRKDGWSRGALGVQEGWFPTSYVAKVSLPVRVVSHSICISLVHTIERRQSASNIPSAATSELILKGHPTICVI